MTLLQPRASLRRLREHLQWAIELEHATIPPYLCALYSLDSERNVTATHILRTVLMEEMLHLALAANLLNAVGGTARLDRSELLPPYPHPLPHGDRSIQLHLGPYGPAALDLFLRIEKPTPPEAPPLDNEYRTIGQFYAAIERDLCELCLSVGEDKVFSGPAARQIGDVHLHGGSGRMIIVRDLESALAALGEIVEQGEGAARTDVWDGDRDVFHPERDQVAHYYRFYELRQGRCYRRNDTPHSGPTGDAIAIDPSGVLPMRLNPQPNDFPSGSPIRTAQDDFNRTYCGLLNLLEQSFNGSPSTLGDAVGVMFMLRTQATSLMQMPTGDGLTTAGPTFEYVPRDRRR